MMYWQCIHCGLGLNRQEQAWICPNGHNFDIAKEGYVNMLTGKQKPGGQGDSPEMLRSRRRFLAGGWYGRLRERLMELVQEGRHEVILEAGCGEGYYLGGMSEAFPEAVCLGTDIAKEGVRLAAKRYTGAQWAVADTYAGLPVRDGSVDVVLDVFAPRKDDEFARVLRPEGRLVVVIPGERHLVELRELVPMIGIQAGKRQMVERDLASFELLQAEPVVFGMRIKGEVVADLVTMTPNARFLNQEQRDSLGRMPEIEVTAAFELLVFGRNMPWKA